MNGLSIKEMIDAGVHFGHRSKYWNPKMEPYIYTTHKKLHIINLEKSSECFNEAAKYIQKLISNNGKLMFIGTCLLYTSPSPRDAESSRMPSSA